MKSREGLICKPFIPIGARMRAYNAKINFPMERSVSWAYYGLFSRVTPYSY